MLPYIGNFLKGASVEAQGELKILKERLDEKIGAYFDTAIKRADKEDRLVADALRYSRQLMLSGGKRLRAAFMYYGYISANGKEEEKILDASISIEFIHAFLLMHDDIIDRDDLRHGVTTLHRYYADMGKRFFPHKDTEHFGNSMAIIVGDMLGAFGNDIIFRSDFSNDLKFQALSKLQDIVSYTVIGQARDVYMEYQGEATEEEILAMYRNKTAKYTVEGPLHLGGILAGASQALLDGLTAYAVPLGIAFQIQDDILGLYGSAERIGKPVGSDIQEGKITLLVSRALRNGTREQQTRIKALLVLGERFTMRDGEEFCELIRMTGALAETQELAQKYISEGKRSLERIREQVHPRAYEFLLSVAEYMTKREY